MTSMPQMVALYNGMGGGAAGAIAAVELFGGKAQGVTQLVVTLLGALIGAVSLSGSLDRLGQARWRHQEAAARAGPAGLQRAGPDGHPRGRRLHRVRVSERRRSADRHVPL